MITGKELYNVVAAIVPLYVPMVLAYASVFWWKIFTPEQCSGVNRFVAVFAIPFLNFHFLASNDPYAINLRFIAADTLQKIVILGALLLLSTFTKFGSTDWTISLFTLSSLPNTLVVGVPLLTAMYGNSTINLMSQIVVMQSVLWVTVTLFLYEYRAAKRLISKNFPENGASITSITVDSDVRSLNGSDPLQADSETTQNGQLHVVVRSPSFNNFCNCSTHPSIQRSSSFNTTRDLQTNDTYNGVNNEAIDMSPGPKAMGNREVGIVDGNQYPLTEGLKEVATEEGYANKKQQTPRASVMTKFILTVVWRNLIKNPNTYGSVFGLAWSLISFKWKIKMPLIVDGSISVLSKTGTGMAMFSLGLFMALQPKIIACGKTWATLSMAARFLVGPTMMAVTSIVIGIRGVLLRIAIVQAALPQAINSFVFAKEYNLHADIMSTAVIFGTVISLPVTIIYFVLLGL